MNFTCWLKGGWYPMFLPWNTGWCRRPLSSFLLQGPTDTHTHIHTQTKSDGGTPAATHADTHARAAGVKQPGMRVESRGRLESWMGYKRQREKEKQGEGPEGSSLYFVRDRGKQSIWPPTSSPRGHFLIAPVPNPDDEEAWEVMRAVFFLDRESRIWIFTLPCLLFFFLSLHCIPG